MKIGLFFGSFNPIHIGHLIIANYMVEVTELDKIWLVVSPQNPFKKKANLLNEYDRLHLARLAVEDNLNIVVSDVEFNLPKPSYTIDTLTYLREQQPDAEFSIVMGADNLTHFHKWKNYEKILEYYDVYVYRRVAYEKVALEDHPNIHLMDVPLLNISATFIREHIKMGHSMRYFLPEAVYKEVDEMSYYKS